MTQQLYENTMKNFTQYFKPVRNSFDFRYIEYNSRIVIFDPDSPKTKQTLEKVAGDLIRDVKGILGL